MITDLHDYDKQFEWLLLKSHLEISLTQSENVKNMASCWADRFLKTAHVLKSEDRFLLIIKAQKSTKNIRHHF